MTVAVVQRWRSLLLFAGGGLLLALLVAALIVWWRGTHERIERRVALPPQGEAAYNPLYLLREALRADGVDARTRRRLQLDADPPGERDTVLIYSDPGRLGPGEVERLLDWVERGGHLIVSGAFLDDRHTHLDLNLQRAKDAAQDINRHRRRELLAELDVWRHSNPPAGCGGTPAPDDLAALFCDEKRFSLAGEPPALALGSAAVGYVFARLEWGQGFVDVLASLDFLTNRQLAAPPRAALARQLLAPNYGRGSVHLVYAAQMPPLWQLLFEHGTLAWIPLLLALAAWLWLRMPRFGPLRPAPAAARRALLEHIEASGEHLYRYRRIDVLHAALCAAFWQHLQRRDPLAAALRGQAQHAAIAVRTGLGADAVADAFAPPTNRAEFLARTTRLQQLRHRL